MIDLADQAKPTHTFRPPEDEIEDYRLRRLLGAVLIQAYEDLRHGDSQPVAGVSCGCRADRACTSTNHCPHAIPFQLLRVRTWIRLRSWEPWGFSWVCFKLGRDPEAVAAHLLGTYREYALTVEAHAAWREASQPPFLEARGRFRNT